MRRAGPHPLKRWRVDRQYRIEIETGPLWGYQPKVRSKQLDVLGLVVEQHWDAVLEGRDGAGLALATSLRSLSLSNDARPDLDRLLAEAERTVSMPDRPSTPHPSVDLLAVDGRCLQHPDFANRGIGRLARSILHSLAAGAPTISLVVVTDDELPSIDSTSLPRAASVVRSGELDALVGPGHRPGLAVLDPAPMTHPPSTLDRFAARRIAVIHDFVPLHAPDLYLGRSVERLAYLIRFLRLRHHDHFWCNSGAIAAESLAVLGRPPTSVTVLPPPDPMEHGDPSPLAQVTEPFFFAPVGADRRKNLPGAVSTLAHRAQGGWPGDLVILSHMPDPHRKELNDLADASGVDHDRIIVVSDLTDAELVWLYEHAEAAVIPSFDEGLSLPLIEAVDAGCLVIASDIAPHRELLGDDEVLCDPHQPKQFADRVDAVLADRSDTLRRQREAIGRARRRRSFDDIVASLTNPR